MSVKQKLFFLFLSLGFIPTSQAQTIDYKFQSVFIYNFAKNIEWPTANQSDVITIGILGNTKVAKEMEAFFAGKAINSKKLVVKNFSLPTDINYCHILFIPTSNKNTLPKVLQQIGSNPTLIVSEQNGWAKLGSIINFVISEEGQFKFELNKQAAKDHNLKIPQELTNLAILI